ncbi:MAG: NAD(P)H-binding protein [Pseudomonadota bacterium]
MKEGAASQTVPVDRPVLLAGSTGTIGRAVAQCLVDDGYDLVRLVRRAQTGQSAALGREVVQDIADAGALQRQFEAIRPKAVISCIASRSGAPKDAWAVDHDANANLLAAAEAVGVEHFILLSAICVQKPRLAFQHAKLAFESKLIESSVEHTLVRPTAFFKSLSGQIERVRKGKPFMVFGNGELTRCKPISDRDCARFIVDCLGLPNRRGAILPIGGPGPAITMREQGALLFDALGREPHFRSVPVRMFSAFAGVLGLAEHWSDWAAEKAEYARIARYYATESMLVWDGERAEYSADATPEFGSDTLRDHYARLLVETP